MAAQVPALRPTRRSPFVGLEPYDESDAEFFFGRERQQRIISANLRSSRLTLLYGASGVGKSSVLRAGVVHDLRRRLARQAPLARTPPDDERAPYAVTYFDAWREPRPFDRLMQAVHADIVAVSRHPGVEPWEPGATPATAIKGWTQRVGVILVVLDQFEEYFLYHDPEPWAATFEVEFARLVNDPELRPTSSSRYARTHSRNSIASRRRSPTSSRTTCVSTTWTATAGAT